MCLYLVSCSMPIYESIFLQLDLLNLDIHCREPLYSDSALSVLFVNFNVSYYYMCPKIFALDVIAF